MVNCTTPGVNCLASHLSRDWSGAGMGESGHLHESGVLKCNNSPTDVPIRSGASRASDRLKPKHDLWGSFPCRVLNHGGAARAQAPGIYNRYCRQKPDIDSLKHRVLRAAKTEKPQAIRPYSTGFGRACWWSRSEMVMIEPNCHSSKGMRVAPRILSCYPTPVFRRADSPLLPVVIAFC